MGGAACPLASTQQQQRGWGALGVFHWHWGVSGEGGVLGLLGSGPSPLTSLHPLLSPPSSPPSLVSLHEVGGGQLAVYRGCVRWWWSWRVDGNKCAADQAIFGSVTV
jgi:hypothetical protein